MFDFPSGSDEPHNNRLFFAHEILEYKPEEITEITIFFRVARHGFEVAVEDFEARRQIVEYLKVKVVFVEDEDQVAYLSCSFDLEKRLTLNGLVPAQNSFRLHESEPSTNSREGAKDNYM